MGLLSNYFQKEIQTAAKAMAVSMSKSAALTAYNRSVFSWLNNDQVILDADYFDYVTPFETIGAVYEAVTLIANKIKQSPRLVYKIKDAEGYKKFKNLSKSDNIAQRAQAMKMQASVMEEVKVERIDKLLKNPNPNQNGDDFIELMAAQLLVEGNTFLYANAGSNIKDKKWSEMFAMPAEMKIISGGTYNPVKRYFLNWGTPQQQEFPASQIKHIKMVNLRYTQSGTHLYGMSPLRPYLYSMDTIKNGDKQANKQMKNGGKLGFISPKNVEDEFGPDQKDGMKETIVGAYEGTDALDRLIPSSIPLDFTEIGLSSTDLDLLNIVGAKSDDIYRAYKVPLYFRSLESSTYNNVSTAKKQLIYDAVSPLADKIASALTDLICKPYLLDGEEYVIVLDYMSLPELSEDVKTVSEWMEKAFFLTPNEKREVIGFGKLNQPGMDEIYISKNYVLMQDVLDGKTLTTSTAGETDNAAQADGSLV